MKREHITLKLPPENKWVPMLAETVHHYSSILDIPDSLCSMISESLIEGCEELIRICRENNVDDHYEIALDFNSDAVIVKIIFNARIPLHPQQMENYEIPDKQDDLFDVNLDSLWLHLIKKRMDRVFFKVDGNIQSLQMMKYRREAANPKKYWVMGLAPKLKPNVVYSSQNGEGGILQNEENGVVLKLDSSNAFVVRNLDGKKTFQEIYMDYIDEIGMISPQRLAIIFEKLEQSGMLEERRNEEQNVGLVKRLFLKFLNPNFVIPKSDKIISILYKCCLFMFNPFGFLLLLAIGVSGLIPLVQHFDAFKDVIMGLGDFYVKHPLLLLLVYGVALVIITIHELGHGLVCKHYGGSIARMGLMFYLTMFIFYCDTSSAWNFSSRKQRIMVSLGGPLTTFAFWGGSLWLFALHSGTDSNMSIFWGTINVFCLVGLIMNVNPFIKMDAYYILMDLTGINNLRKRSFQFIKSKLKLIDADEAEKTQPTSRREHIIFWCYGCAGAAITGLFVVFPLVYYSWQLLAGNSTINKVVFAIIILLITLTRLANQTFMSIRSRRRKVYKIS